jgi:hypothetical protein
MAEPLGAHLLTVDPVLTARPPASWSATAIGEPCAARPTPSLPVTQPVLPVHPAQHPRPTHHPAPTAP